MEIKKIYEDDNYKNSNNADELSKKLDDKFFKGVSDFSRIEVNINSFNKNAFNFYFCFRSILPKHIIIAEELYEYLGWDKDSWDFQVGTIHNDDTTPVAFIELHLDVKFIEKQLKKFELLDNVDKFNI